MSVRDGRPPSDVQRWAKRVKCRDILKLWRERRCRQCEQPLKTNRQRFYCSSKCGDEFVGNHSWNVAKDLVFKLTSTNTLTIRYENYNGFMEQVEYPVPCCCKCGKVQVWPHIILEVNHIVPIASQPGEDRSLTCLNHQDNLEAVCSPCHKSITKAQHAAGELRRKK